MPTQRTSAPAADCPVRSYNEWDPLEEVIVGRVDGARFPPFHVVERVRALNPVGSVLARLISGRPYPGYVIRKAQRELETFVTLLKQAGVVVRRPEPLDSSRAAGTTRWHSRGFCTASPRDGMLVIGDEIIETASAWRSRYFEVFAYRALLNEYFQRGARWSAAPRPQLDDRLYDYDYRPPGVGEPLRYATTEAEPVLDAADFARCGRDLFVNRTNTTNLAGIEWLRRHLGPAYTIHRIHSRDRMPMHIDTTFIPLAPGKVLINPEYIDPDELPPILDSWDVLIPPSPDPVPTAGLDFHLTLTSNWIFLNVLMLDSRRVFVEEHQVSLIRAFERWGFEPIPCPFLHYKMFGAGFHCATLDVRRRGELQSYF